jgi:hypothetical protein
MTTPWMMNGKEFELSENTYKEIYGFVYLITCNRSSKRYIGKKFFWSSKTKTLKGKKKRFKVESDWKTYFGSNKTLIEDVKIHGEENYTREILHLCKTKGECNYLEAHEQFTRNVLIGESYYNEWIFVKVHRSHINGLQQAKTVI